MCRTVGPSEIFTQDIWFSDTLEKSAAMALKNGCDVNCGNTYLHLWKAYQCGVVTEGEITEAAERLFTTRFLLGLFSETE